MPKFIASPTTTQIIMCAIDADTVEGRRIVGRCEIVTIDGFSKRIKFDETTYMTIEDVRQYREYITRIIATML